MVSYAFTAKQLEVSQQTVSRAVSDLGMRRVFLVEGFFLAVSEDLALSGVCPEVHWANFMGTEELRARRGLSIALAVGGEGAGGGGVDQIHGGDGEQVFSAGNSASNTM